MTKRSILVIRLGAMGDIVHALPAVATMKASFPDSHLTWVVDEKWPALLQGNPYIDEISVVNRKSLRSLLELRRRLRKQPFDLAVDSKASLSPQWSHLLLAPNESLACIERRRVRRSPRWSTRTR